MAIVIGKKRRDDNTANAETLANQINQFDALSDLDAWIEVNVTTLVDAKVALKFMGCLLWAHEKRLRKIED